MLALWFHIACLLLVILGYQFIVKYDYANFNQAGWIKRDDQIEAALYLYTPFVGSVLIVILHTRMAVQAIVYSLRSNKPEDDLRDISPIDTYILSLRFKAPEPNYYNQVKIICLKRTVIALGSEFLALSTLSVPTYQLYQDVYNYTL